MSISESPSSAEIVGKSEVGVDRSSVEIASMGQTIIANLRGKSEGGTGPDLTGYPMLTYAPQQYGEGVRIARTGAEVQGIILDSADLVKQIDAIASSEGVTMDELFDALKYARANGAV